MDVAGQICSVYNVSVASPHGVSHTTAILLTFLYPENIMQILI